MAKNVTVSSIKNYTGIRVVYSQISQSIPNNRSVLRASVYRYTTGYSSAWYGASSVSVTVDGQTKSISVPTWNVSGSTSVHIGNLDFTVNHNNAGGKSASLRHVWNIDTYFYQSGTGTFYFDTIPRASTIGNINQTQIATSMTIGISRASSSFTHQVWWRLPGQAWQNLGTGHTTSATFTIPIGDISYLPNSSNGVLEVSIQTKSGSTNIGSEVRKNFTVYIPSSIIPSFTSLKIEEGDNRVINYTDYIQNISKLKVSILGASGIYGSTVKSYKLEVDDQVLNAQSGITQSIRKYGRLPVKGTVTDSRNRTFSMTEYVEVVPYSLPQFLNNTPTFVRCKQDGTDDPLGQYVKISVDSKVFSVKDNGIEKNKLIIKIESKKLNEREFVTKSTLDGSDLTYTSEIILGLYDLDYSYNFRVLLQDDFNTTIAVGVIAEGKVAVQIMNEALSIGFITTEDKRNLYIGEKGLKTYGSMVNQDEIEFIALGGEIVEYDE